MEFRVEIRELQECDSHKWDSLLEKSSHSTPFHRFDWLKIMERYTNTKLLLLVGLDGEEVFAAMPLFIQKSFKGLITKVFSPPYPTQVPYLGPIFIKYDEWKESLREARLRAFHQELDNYLRTKIRPQVTLIVTAPGLVDARPYIDTGYNVLPKFTYVCDISDKEKIWKGFSHSLRKKIVNSEKLGMQIEEGELNEFKLTINVLRALLKEKEKRLETSDTYFLEIYEKFHSSNLKIFVLKYKEKNLTGIFLLMDKNKIWMWMGLPKVKIKGIYPNELLQWKTIEWGNDQGYRLCEIIDAQTSTSFKAQFNFDLEKYYSIYKKTYIYGIASNIYKLIT